MESVTHTQQEINGAFLDIGADTFWKILFFYFYFLSYSDRSARSEKSPCPNLKHKSLLLLSECLARCGVNSVDLKMQKRVNNDEFGRY